MGNRQRLLRSDAAKAAAALLPSVEDVEAGVTFTDATDAQASDDADDSDTRGDGCDSATISPVYLSRMLNAVACSIAICRDDSLSIVALIELSRRFSNGLWSCIQFWASCACSLALLQTLCAAAGLPPVLTPAAVLWLMCVAVPLLAVTLVRTDGGDRVMHRAAGKKHTRFERGVFGFVAFCYGCKFLPSMVVMVSERPGG